MSYLLSEIQLTPDGKPILNLPERNVEVVECEFDEDERAFYTALEAKTSVAFNKVCCEI